MRLPVFAALFSICSLHAAQAPPFHWSGKLDSGKTITIKNVNGSVRAQFSAGAETSVAATRTAQKSNPDEVRIFGAATADGYIVCALYPGDANDCNSSRHQTRNNDTKVEFTIQVPSGIRLKADTVNGTVSAQGLRADVSASTVNGAVDVSTQGGVEAMSVNGSIHASMGRLNWSDSRKFHTVNGNIDLDLPASASTEIRANTVTGGISSDFPLKVSGSFGGKSIAGTIGSGGRSLEINTVNGSIHLRQRAGGAI